MVAQLRYGIVESGSLKRTLVNVGTGLEGELMSKNIVQPSVKFAGTTANLVALNEKGDGSIEVEYRVEESVVPIAIRMQLEVTKHSLAIAKMWVADVK